MAVDVQERSRLVEDLLERIGESVGQRAQVSAVFGEPVERGSLTVIPVAKARFGFGGGGGFGTLKGEEGSGGGGGGGASPRSATSKWAMRAPSSNESQPQWTCSPSSRESRSLHSRSNGCSTDMAGAPQHMPEPRLWVADRQPRARFAGRRPPSSSSATLAWGLVAGSAGERASYRARAHVRDARCSTPSSSR
jgi:hypothetical protein